MSTIPQASLFFVKKIKEELEKNKFDVCSFKTEYITINTNDYEYSYYFIKPIERAFSRDGWVFSLTSYSRDTATNSHSYRFTLKRK